MIISFSCDDCRRVEDNWEFFFGIGEMCYDIIRRGIGKTTLCLALHEWGGDTGEWIRRPTVGGASIPNAESNWLGSRRGTRREKGELANYRT
jgi:hypothetical protein